ncbi:MAG: hypothetical protein ACKOTD_12285, partial [Phycisphaerales bacterium]
MRAIPAEKVETLSAKEFAERAAKADQCDVIVANPAALPAALPPGRYLCLGVPAGVEGLNPYGTKEGLAVRAQKASHPLLRAVNLDDLFVAKSTFPTTAIRSRRGAATAISARLSAGSASVREIRTAITPARGWTSGGNVKRSYPGRYAGPSPGFAAVSAAGMRTGFGVTERTEPSTTSSRSVSTASG